MHVEISYDPAKNQRNIADRGLSFERAADFDFETALFWVDTRKDYPETRIAALGLLDGRLHSLIFTETEHGIRVIRLTQSQPTRGQTP